MNKLLFCLTFLFSSSGFCQSFERSELSTPLSNPWEIIYGPDNMLWISENGGIVSRVDPETGLKTIAYTASDFYWGSTLESSVECPAKPIGAGTLGMALHPDFTNPDSSFIYFVYSYNNGTTPAPDTRFKIRRLKWDATTQQVTSYTDIVTGISNGFDHWGGRLMAVKRNNVNYLFLSVGDHGISESNSPECYNPQTNNPNNFAQDPSTDNGKIHRYNMDGTIPFDNPIPGNSFYTRGHRNPQGLMYNADLDILYDIEHGDRTDDEINILEKGMNYGWKNVRGYHSDENVVGESAYVASYIPDPSISNDHLVEPFYAFCTEPTPTDPNASAWCTVAPSDGIHYNSSAIPEWKNSLLLVTLKDGLDEDMELYQFKLTASGALETSTVSNPNPKRFFGSDQQLNGRLRDIAVSPDGKKLFLINNGGGTTNTSKISIYTYIEPVYPQGIQLGPNPTNGTINISHSPKSGTIRVLNAEGEIIRTLEVEQSTQTIDLSNEAAGIYYVEFSSTEGVFTEKIVVTN